MREVKKMSIMFIDYAVLENCENPYSYGEICVGCNACGRFDKKTRLESKLKVLEEWLEDRKNFDMWAEDEEIRKIQEKNLSESIKEIEREIKRLKKLIERRKQRSTTHHL